jgi:hypothetical protein
MKNIKLTFLYITISLENIKQDFTFITLSPELIHHKLKTEFSSTLIDIQTTIKYEKSYIIHAVKEKYLLVTCNLLFTNQLYLKYNFHIRNLNHYQIYSRLCSLNKFGLGLQQTLY